MIKNLLDKLKLDKEKGIKVAIVLGLLAMCIILISEIIPSKSEKQSTSSEKDIEILAYCRQMEEELSQILSKIKGVGKVEVMLTISSTGEYIYAEEVKQSSSSEQKENKYVLIDGGGGKKEALVKKIMRPQIKGVVIAIEGGNDAKICERVYNAVTVALGVSANRIYIAPLESKK